MGTQRLLKSFNNEKEFKPEHALFCRFGARNALLYGIYCKFANARIGGNFYEMLSQQKSHRGKMCPEIEILEQICL